VKRVFLFIPLFFLCLSGCSREGEHAGPWERGSGKLKVLSTIGMIDSLIKEVGGDVIDCLCLIDKNIDPHSYELLKGDDEKLQGADLIFCNGLGLEHGASLQHQLECHPETIRLGELIFRDKKERLIFVDGQVDPHIWMDVELFSFVIDPIVTALSKKDPAHAGYFRENGEKLKKDMLQLDRELMERMGQLSEERRYFAASHEGFYYLIKRYVAFSGEEWQERFSAPEGLAPDGQLSVCDICRVSDFLCRHRIPVLFPEANSRGDVLQKLVSVCQEKGHRMTISPVPLYADTMGEGSYLEMMRSNIETLLICKEKR
jgi:manganese/zinc/iron transport system substrate-binding protein